MLVSILVLGIIAIESNQIRFKARGVPAAEAAAEVRGQTSDVRHEDGNAEQGTTGAREQTPGRGRGSKLQIPTAKLQ